MSKSLARLQRLEERLRAIATRQHINGLARTGPMADCTQISRVLAAVNNGFETSVEVAVQAGITKKEASAYLSLLAARGRIEKIGEVRFLKESLTALTARAVNRYGPLKGKFSRAL